jgi:hypothetical protein
LLIEEPGIEQMTKNHEVYSRFNLLKSFEMAKIGRSIIKIQGRVGDLVMVKSNTYKDHVRAPRGTYKEADVNDVLKSNANRTAGINNVCKEMYPILLNYCKDCKHGQLWQDMLSCVRKSSDDSFEQRLLQLKGLEMNKDYLFSAFYGAHPPVSCTTDRKALNVIFSPKAHPQFGDKRVVATYKVCMVAIFPQEDSNWLHMTAFSKSIEVSTKELEEFHFEFKKPPKTKHYIVGMIIVGLQPNGHGPFVWSKRMRIVDVGRFETGKAKVEDQTEQRDEWDRWDDCPWNVRDSA